MQDQVEGLSVGIPLHTHGINNWALSREQVLQLIPDLERRRVAITGGDVCEMIGQKPVLNNDNWYCNRSAGEALDSYIEKSHEKTREYVQTYVSPRGHPVLFILVLAA